MAKELLIDSFDIPKGAWRVDESVETKKIVDGKHLLAVVKGPFFTVDGESRNKRFYSKALWEKALNESGEIMENGLMLGALGHEQPLNDEDLADGKASHKVVNLKIEEASKYGIENQKFIGVGEIHVLGSRTGHELNNLLRAKVGLSVSSRAYGEPKGRTESGAEIINPDKFLLKTFDFVQSPGVEFATPNLIERNPKETIEVEIKKDKDEAKVETKVEDKDLSIEEKKEEEIVATKFKQEELVMDNNAAELLKKEIETHSQTKNELDKTLDKVTDLETKIQEKAENVGATGEKLEGLRKEVAELKAQIEEANKFIEEVGPTQEDIKKALEAAREQHEQFKAEKEEAKETIVKLATMEAELKIFTDLELTVEQIQEYKDIDSAEDIKEAFKATTDMLAKLEEDKRDEAVESLVNEVGIDNDMAKKILSKMSMTEAIEMFASVKGSKEPAEKKTSKEVKEKKIIDRYRKSSNQDSLNEVNPTDDDGPKSVIGMDLYETLTRNTN